MRAHAACLFDKHGIEELRHDTEGWSFLGLRAHHIAIALIAILVAVALASNYYLW